MGGKAAEKRLGIKSNCATQSALTITGILGHVAEIKGHVRRNTRSYAYCQIVLLKYPADKGIAPEFVKAAWLKSPHCCRHPQAS